MHQLHSILLLSWWIINGVDFFFFFFGEVVGYVRLFVIPCTVAYQAPPSMEFSRQEDWSGLPVLLQGIFLTQGSKPGLPHHRQALYHLSHQDRWYIVLIEMTPVFITKWTVDSVVTKGQNMSSLQLGWPEQHHENLHLYTASQPNSKDSQLLGKRRCIVVGPLKQMKEEWKE